MNVFRLNLNLLEVSYLKGSIPNVLFAETNYIREMAEFYFFFGPFLNKKFEFDSGTHARKKQPSKKNLEKISNVRFQKPK